VADPLIPASPALGGSRVGALVARLTGLAGSRGVRWGFGAVALALAVWALVGRRDAVLSALHRLDARYLVLAALSTLANEAFTALAWRALLTDLGSRLPLPAAARVFFVGQLGKYLPGSLWPLVVQAELARDHGVPRRRAAAASLVMILLSAASGLLVVLGCLPLVPSVARSGYGWAILLVVPLLVVLHPAVIGRVLDRLLGLVGGEALEQRPSLRGTAVATAWAVGSWVTAGLQVWLLAVPLGLTPGTHTMALAIGGYALAWAVGLVVVVAPAGVGAREVALAAVLSSALDGGAVVVVVLLSRVLFSAADLALAGVGLAIGRAAKR
jgi:glycosyltransferase 2 family protein